MLSPSSLLEGTEAKHSILFFISELSALGKVQLGASEAFDKFNNIGLVILSMYPL